MGVTVRLDVGEGGAVALSFAATTVGRAVRVGVKLGVGLETVGEMPASASGVGPDEQPAMILTMVTKSRNAVSAGIPVFRLLTSRRRKRSF